MVGLRERLHQTLAANGLVPRNAQLIVDAGSVPCPNKGDVSIEQCLACAYLHSVEGDPITRIECRPGRGSMATTASQPIG